ncbi:MAG TPA: NAD-dependent epimerase/dehydratase family protein [Caldilineae bacterium]|nr:NAD-dependent epimerase/dehydratase family protein [Caldilineae bacterium]
MNVLVIGGTRFIGRAIVEELLQRGHTVTVYHRGQHEIEFSAPVTHVHGDRRDYARFRADLARLSPEAVVDVIPMNADDARAVVEALRGRIARSVHISSGDVYAPDQPIPISEDAPIRPAEPVELRLDDRTVPYSKVAVEAVIREAQAAGDFPATILRLPAVYGPGDPVAQEWFFVRRVLDGRCRIALPDGGLGLFHRGYVDDVARAVALALESSRAVGRTYNVGHERVLTVRGIAELVAEVMGHAWEILFVPASQLPPTNPYAPPYPIVYDLNRIREELDYRESVSLEEGMRRTVAWLVENPPSLETWRLARYLSHDAFDYAAEDAAIRAMERRGG